MISPNVATFDASLQSLVSLQSLMEFKNQSFFRACKLAVCYGVSYALRASMSGATQSAASTAGKLASHALNPPGKKLTVPS